MNWQIDILLYTNSHVILQYDKWYETTEINKNKKKKVGFDFLL